MVATYWISTTLSALALALSAFAYFFHEATIKGIAGLGFPGFFRVQLGFLQAIAAIALLVPVPAQAKEWVYAGAALFYLTAIVAHIAHRDSHFITAINLVLLLVLLISNVSLHKLNSA